MKDTSMLDLLREVSGFSMYSPIRQIDWKGEGGNLGEEGGAAELTRQAKIVVRVVRLVAIHPYRYAFWQGNWGYY